MAFVKLDTGILNSTLWIERDQREIFITALLMADPQEFPDPIPQIAVGSLEFTGFEAPPGWYGFVPAASVGIINRAGVDREAGIEALRRLGEPEIDSRSKDYGGRRMIRADGGFVILIFMKYRDNDHSAAVRQQRLRDRRKAAALEESSRRDITPSQRDATLPSRNITQAEAEAEADKEQKQKPSRGKREFVNPQVETLYKLYPRHVARDGAIKAIEKSLKIKPFDELLLSVQAFARKCSRENTEDRYIAHPATWFNRGSYDDEDLQPGYTAKINGGENGRSGEGKPSPAKQRVDDNRRALAEVAIERGWLVPPGAAQPNGQAVPESGLNGSAAGVHERPGANSPEILPPRN